MRRRLPSLTLSTQAWLLVLLMSLSFVLIASLYTGFRCVWDRELHQYKQQLAKEQSYHLLYTIRERLKHATEQAERLALFQEASQHFSVPIQYTGPNREDLYINLLDPQWQARPSIYATEVPVVIDGHLEGYLITYYDMEQASYSPALQVLEQQYQLRSKQLLTASILAALLVCTGLAWRISRSIRTTARLAESIVIDNRPIPLKVHGTEELKIMITAINTLMNQFERHEAWRNQLMQDLTHELRTPLTAVLSHLDAIIDGIYPLTTEHIQRILVDIERLYRLVEDMEKLSEAEGAQFELNKQEVNLSRLVQNIYEGFLFLSRDKEIQFEFVPSRTPCMLLVDPDRMMQILSNVMYNAIKYTPRGGHIQVGLLHQNGSIYVFCKDTGMGIAAEDLTRIFDRFYRTDKSRSRDSGGLGVGLSIAKALVEAHQGEIWCESKLGEGSTFWIRLPSHPLSILEQNRQSLTAG